MSEEYFIPDNLKLMPIEMLGSCEPTRKAVVEGAKWLDRNPRFNPEYVRMFNVILANNAETIAMHREVFELAGHPLPEKGSEPDLPFPGLGVDLPTYAIAINGIKKYGFYEYIFLLEQLEVRKKWAQMMRDKA